MPRPPRPLIRRDTAVHVALEMIDRDGLEALSMPKMARLMGVQAPSLYHHFTSKDEILEEVARSIVLETVIPRKPPPEEWPEWFVATALNLRRVILRHANAAPVLLRFLPRDLLVSLFDDAAVFLTSAGIPPALQVRVLDGMEKLTLGASIAEAMNPRGRGTRVFPQVDPDVQVALARAVDANDLNATQMFEETVRSFLAGIALLLPNPRA